MRELDWRSDREFTVGGVNFECAPLGDYTGKTTSERFLLLKDRNSIEQYATVLKGQQPKNILEFGIFQGGSPALFSLWFDAHKFVGIDIAEPIPAFDEFCRTHPIGSRISTYYQTSQDDRSRIEEIVRREFCSAPIDLIIDDASHYYEYSRASFEISFPLLCPGGTYVIEDWGWAHWPHIHSHYLCRPPLSILIMELVMLCASRSDLISDIQIYPSFAFIHKSPSAPSMENFKLEGSYLKRNIEIREPHLMEFSEIGNLFGKKVRERAERRVQRTKEKIKRVIKGKGKR